MKKLTTTEFVERSKIIHGDKYSYEKTVYEDRMSPVIISCKKHGEFLQKPHYHLIGCGCQKCNPSEEIDTEEFIRRAKKKHGEKYDYGMVQYVTSNDPVNIICKTHGIFKQKPRHHLFGCGCFKCSRRSNTDLFIDKAILIHGDKYSYEKTIYEKSNKKVCITCNKHGDFYQTPNSHLNKNGCQKCQYESMSINFLRTKEEFKDEANKVHKNKYDYSKVKYLGCFTKVCIVCKKHGEFWQSPARHIFGSGCKKCSNHISKMEDKWLTHKGVPDSKDNRQVLLNVNGKKFYVDGYIQSTKTVYEFYGDFWHGNPKKYPPNQINIVNKKSFGHLYQETVKKEKELENEGYRVISIWESDFKNISD